MLTYTQHKVQELRIKILKNLKTKKIINPLIYYEKIGEK